MCQLCETNPVYEFTNKRKLCKRCFINWFQKKALYTIRKYNMINNSDTVGYYDENEKNFRQAVLEEILKMYSQNKPVEIVKIGKNKKIDSIAVPDSIDILAYQTINEIIDGKASKLKKNSPVLKQGKRKTIRPLFLFLDEEIKLYAKIKNIKFKNKNSKKNKTEEFIEELEKKHPEIKRAIVKSYLNLFEKERD